MVRPKRGHRLCNIHPTTTNKNRLNGGSTNVRTMLEAIRLALIKALQKMVKECTSNMGKFKSEVQQWIESIVTAS
jgi:hypothetical protein